MLSKTHILYIVPNYHPQQMSPFPQLAFLVLTMAAAAAAPEITSP